MMMVMVIHVGMCYMNVVFITRLREQKILRILQSNALMVLLHLLGDVNWTQETAKTG